MASSGISIPRNCPRCLLPLWRILQDQQAGLIQAPFKSMPLWGELELERFCVHLYEQSLYFPQPSSSPVHNPCWPSKPDVLGTCLPVVGSLSREAWYGAWSPHLPGKPFTIVTIFPFVGHLPRMWVWTLLCLCPFYHLTVVPSLVVEYLFC